MLRMEAIATHAESALTKDVSKLLVVSVLINACIFVVAMAVRTFRLDGHLWFLLDDDPMISMRYARNLAEGNGLVWNVGERVEGFTNPLWVGVMTIPHLMSLPTHQTSLFMLAVNFILGGLLVVLAFRLAQAIAGNSPHHQYLTPLAVFAVASYLPLLYFGVLGYETTLLAVFLTAAWLDVVKERASPVRPFLFVTLAVLTRPDAALFFLPVAASYVLAHRTRDLVPAMLVSVCILGLAEVGRFLYYDEVLPNTYYLKGTLMLEAGAEYVAKFFILGGGGLVVAALALSTYVTLSRQTALLLGTFLIVSGYCWYVGGDWMNLGRFFMPFMPVVIVTSIVSGGIAFSRVIEPLLERSATPGLFRSPIVVTACVVLLFILSLNVWTIRSFQLHGSDLLRMGDENARIGVVLDELLPEDAVVADVFAGIVPYITMNPGVDLLGKTDPVVAKGPSRGGELAPGHTKYDFAHSLGNLRPDILLIDVPPELARNPQRVASSDLARGAFAFNGEIFADPIFLAEYSTNMLDLDLRRAVFVREGSTVLDSIVGTTPSQD